MTPSSPNRGPLRLPVDGSDINAPNNVAFDPNDNVISINTTGALSMSAGLAVGTSFNGGTPALTTSVLLPRNASEITIIFSIFDVRDSRFDSGVFLDNIRFSESQDEGTTTASALDVVIANDEVRIGESILIVVNPPDGLGSATGDVFFRGVPSGNFDSATLTAQNDGTFTATIPAGVVTEAGVQYHVRLGNGQQNFTFPGVSPEENPAFIPVFLDRITSPVAPAPGLYRMISVPLTVESNAIQSVLSDDFGDFDDEVWRLFLINSSTETYIPGFVLGEGFQPGRAFWLTTASGGRFDVENAVSVNSSKATTVRLEPGWNQIANPYSFRVAWTSVDNRAGVEDPVFWNGAEYEFGQTVLDPWEGYFVFNTSSEPVDLKVQPQVAQRRQAKTSAGPRFLEQARYAVRLSALAPNQDALDTQNFVGFTRDASTVAVHDAPPVGAYIRLGIASQGAMMAASLVPETVDGASWDLELDHHFATDPFALRKRVQLGFTETGTRPEGMELFLFDLDTKQLLSRNAAPTELVLTEDTPRRLRFVVGTPAFAEHVGEGAGLVPNAFTLAPNYPNPFSEETVIPYTAGATGSLTLTIYNALGQKVRTLISSVHEAGIYNTVWDGSNDAGERVADGIYLLRMQADGHEQTRILTLHR